MVALGLTVLPTSLKWSSRTAKSSVSFLVSGTSISAKTALTVRALSDSVGVAATGAA